MMKIYDYLKRDRGLIEFIIVLTIASLLFTINMIIAFGFGGVVSVL